MISSLTNKHLLGALLLLLALSCRAGRPATRDECATILARIIELELQEQGYRDRELLRRRTLELQTRYAAALDQCEGRALPTGAMACIRSASSAEAISHQCLRDR